MERGCFSKMTLVVCLVCVSLFVLILACLDGYDAGVVTPPSRHGVTKRSRQAVSVSGQGSRIEEERSQKYYATTISNATVPPCKEMAVESANKVYLLCSVDNRNSKIPLIFRNTRANCTTGRESKDDGTTSEQKRGEKNIKELVDSFRRDVLFSVATIAAALAGIFLRKFVRKVAWSLDSCQHTILQKGSLATRIETWFDSCEDEKCSERLYDPEMVLLKQWTCPIASFCKIWVSPVARFLPSTFSQGNPLDYEGYRLASMAALSTSCKFSRLRLASAGFHFDPAKNINAVVCHKCGATISVGTSPQECSPLAHHHRQSPNCPFVKDIMDTFTEDPASLSCMGFSGANPGQNQPASMGSSGSSSSPTSSLSTASSLGTYSLSSSASPSSMSSARSLQTTSSLSSVSTGRTYATGTSEYSSLPQLSSVGETSLSSGSTLPPVEAACVDLPDSRRDLMTDDADASPAADSHKPAPHRQQASDNSGYYMALPSTGQNVLMSASLVPSARPSVPIPIASSSASAAAVKSSIPGLDDKPILDLSGAVYPQFSTVHTRMATFAEWPLERYFPANHMVNIGFYFAGYADCVRCFYCGVGLKTWFEDDDPLVEHIRWRPDCQFILATKGRYFVADTLARTEAAERNADTN